MRRVTQTPRTYLTSRTRTVSFNKLTTSAFESLSETTSVYRKHTIFWEVTMQHAASVGVAIFAITRAGLDTKRRVLVGYMPQGSQRLPLPFQPHFFLIFDFQGVWRACVQLGILKITTRDRDGARIPDNEERRRVARIPNWVNKKKCVAIWTLCLQRIPQRNVFWPSVSCDLFALDSQWVARVYI